MNLNSFINRIGLTGIILINIFQGSVFAQYHSRNLTQYTEIEGVPASEVGSIIQDRDGYIWVGTLNGLARFDGYEFKRYFNNPNDPNSIRGLQVSSLYQDRKGRIWVSTSPEILNAYDPASRTFTTYEYKHLIAHPVSTELIVSSMCEDPAGRIYFGVSANEGEDIPSGLLYMDPGDTLIHQFEIPDSSKNQNVNRMTVDSRGQIWICAYNGISRIDARRQWNKFKKWDDVFQKNDDYAIDLVSDSAGTIWLISPNAVLYAFYPETNEYQRYTPGRPFNKNWRTNLVMDQNSNIWMGVDQGLLIFNTELKRYENFVLEKNHPLNQTTILAINPDNFGNLWIGTNTAALFKYENKAVFKSLGYHQGQKKSITNGWATALYEARDGNIYVATGDWISGGISMLSPDDHSVLKSIFSEKLSAYVVTSFLEPFQNEFWIGSFHGIYQYDPSQQTKRKLKMQGFPDTTIVRKFLQDQAGNIWIGTLNGLFCKKTGKPGYIKYDLSRPPGNASSNEVPGLVESPRYGLWILTNNGLFLYDYANDRMERHGFDKTKGDVFVTQDINSLYEDSSGIVWVGTWQGGLSQYNPVTRKIKTYTQEDGLPSMCIQSILADEKRNTLWMGTFEGISRFDLNDHKFYNYSILDGIQGQLYADGVALRTSKGTFIFGGSNGITLFNSDDISEKSIPPRVFLTGLKLFNQVVLPDKESVLKKPIQETEEIVLKNEENNITIEFSAIHYSNPSKNRTIYILEGFETEWREAGNQQQATYSNLSPGQYTFRVKAANHNGVWNEKGASLKILILPPWWNTRWAYIGYFILLLSGGVSLDRYLRHRIIEKERERYQQQQLEQAKEIEKAYLELGQAHESLKATQAQLIQSEKMASLGELTAGIAHEIQNPLNFVNNFSEINLELLEELKAQRSKVQGESPAVRIAFGSPDRTGDEQIENELLNDIEENEEKINHHGKRADAIVKGMLLHSRTTSGNAGEKEPVDINAMVDEYFRLAYHGLRAKDKSFNAGMNSDFDPSIGTIRIIPQDIGRVILNIITNAFYAVNKKNLEQETDLLSTTSDSQQPVRSAYEPLVTVSTKKFNHHIEVRVKDNGIGIPKKNLEKIFQPFFTTKPVGQGTGLGLSISYDIVKANGGELKVNSIEGEGSEFIIQLPVP